MLPLVFSEVAPLTSVEIYVKRASVNCPFILLFFCNSLDSQNGINPKGLSATLRERKRSPFFCDFLVGAYLVRINLNKREERKTT